MNRPFAAALMLGGKSRRMGVDKASLRLSDDGDPLWRIQLSKLAALQPAELLVSTRSEQLGFEFPDARIVPDLAEDAGPLAGIAACLQSSTQPLVLCLAVDMPLITTEILDQQLLANAGENRGVVPQIGRRWEPLAAVYPKILETLAIECLTSDDLSLQNFVRQAEQLRQIQTWPVDPANADSFTNINTNADWAAVRASG